MQEIHCPKISFTENKREEKYWNNWRGNNSSSWISAPNTWHKKHRRLNTASSLSVRLNTHSVHTEGTGLYLSHIKLHYKSFRNG